MFTRRQFGFTSFGAAIAGMLSKPSAASARSYEVSKSDDEWRKVLSKQEFYVLRQHGTERAYSSPLDKTYSAGTYHCAGCQQALFSSKTKFDSGTGWPSFYQPLPGAVGTSRDFKLAVPRTEVHCSRCGGHLGHVFKDGPKPTGLRYCMNGVAMDFRADG